MANKKLVINNPDTTKEQKALGLLICAAQEFQAVAIKSIAHLGISPLQLNMLHVLDKGPEKGLTVNQIKKFMIEESPNVSRALNKLMDKELIVKTRDKVDQRVVHIQITDKGRKLHAEADGVMVPNMKLDLPESDIDTLYDILLKL
ncbi:MAG: MarR family transcriptional regulator [Bacteroidales bacterium]|jgi:DNA-binding MarR family transcriptional regulator|nr:MarR family transcriptional regulator [Bacteroidales bacterium]